MLFLGSSFSETSSQQQHNLMEEVISLLSEVLSWPWPKIREGNSVTKTGMGTDLIEPDILFEPIFIQESLITLFQQLYQISHHLSCRYFLTRFETTLPQTILNTLTILGSYSPHSFASTRTHAQHLHRLTSFALNVIQQSYLQAVTSTGGIIDANTIENDTKEKIRIVLLLKTILCTPASGVMVFLPSWSDVVHGMRGLVDVVLEVSLRECFLFRI